MWQHVGEIHIHLQDASGPWRGAGGSWQRVAVAPGGPRAVPGTPDVLKPPTERRAASAPDPHHLLPQKNFTFVKKEACTNLRSPEGENYCMSNNKHLNST